MPGQQGRALKPRKSYIQDAAFLLKLGAAIESDDEIKADLRRDVVQKINDLSAALSSLKMPPNGHGKAKGK